MGGRSLIALSGASAILAASAAAPAEAVPLSVRDGAALGPHALPATSAQLPPPAPEMVDQAPPERRRSTQQLGASAAIRWFVSYGSVLFGGRAGYRVGRFSGAVEALASRHTTHLGTSSIALAAAQGTVELWQWETPRLRLGLGVGAAVGVTWVTGETDRSSVTVQERTAIYADERLVAVASILLGSIWIEGSLDAGRAAGLAAFAGGETAGATGGWYVGSTLGFGLNPF